MKKAKVNLSNICAYIQGNFRYYCYYHGFQWLMRRHILEQIRARILSMDQECYKAGQCKLCGCSTTALQMANKTCEGLCYPSMLNKTTWSRANTGMRSLIYKDDKVWVYDVKKCKFTR